MKTILIVEDNFDLVLSRNGLEALEKMSSLPDIVLMDLSMPEMDGWTAIREIRKGNSSPKVPIIALTAHAMMGEKERALKAGADDFITKPIDFDLLFDTIDLLIE